MIVTAGLPYANGEIHLGHLVEYLQADFWVRFQKLRGVDCRYFCADDTHGTPIMVAAKQKNLRPEELIDAARLRHMEDFRSFQIHFDHYSSTHSAANQELCGEIFAGMQRGGHIETRSIQQAYCEHDQMFLPDRFVKGICPRCGATDQYGDSCDSCGATYAPTELKQPACSICGNPPTKRASEHVFFKLNDFKDFLRDWLPAHTSKEVTNKMLEWFEQDLRDWDISRDAPYFGFPIPGFKDKYFYVWVDAPIGYMATAKEWCEAQGRDFAAYWAGSEIYHFIGKDIVYFHTLFWPAMLKAAGYNLPTQVFVHGMLTVNAVKMSKSKGTFINARTYLKHLDPMYLRYYYACKFNASMEDVDLNLEDFLGRVNSDLVGKITNLASRGAQMLNKRLDGRIGSMDSAGAELVNRTAVLADEIAALYEAREFAKVLRILRDQSDEANRYFDEMAPWKTIKDSPEQAREVLSTTLNFFRLLAIYLKPILPEYVAKVEELLRIDELKWSDLSTRLVDHGIAEYQPLAVRIEASSLEALVEDSKEKLSSATPVAPLSDSISMEEFMKVDLRVARIAAAEPVEGADKLLRLQLDLGPYGQRQVFAGISKAYQAQDLVGRLTLAVANLQPRKMKFGVSEAMVLAAGAGGNELYLFSPDAGAKPGDRAK